ncbi:MAG: hypothetical protein K0S26_3324, partial [Bacteroidota bacterium]|nr:hypothetical protein [Bacteroidota bacterium]
TNSASSIVTVNSNPVVSVNSATICEGGSVELVADGAVTYSWDPSSSLNATAGATVTANPTITTIYTITGTSSSGCINSTTAMVYVNSNPTVSVNSATICEGASAVLTATGGNSYIWSTGATTGSISVSPNTNTSYTVTGSVNGCPASSVAAVTVLNAPTIGADANPASICTGASSTLTATGANTYSWSTGATGSSISVSPSGTTNYMVTGIAGNGCSNTVSVNVTVTSCSDETAMSSVPCGLVLASMKTVAKAMSVTGANQYRFNFYDNTTGTLVATKTQTSCAFIFNTISGLYYGNTYKWTVAVDKGIGFGPESSNACTVTFDSPKTTLPCGNSCSNLSSYSTCGFVYSGSGYRFSFYNSSTNALVAVKTQTSNYIYFNTVPGLAYGNTYKWTVEVLYNNGSSMVYGAPSSSLCTMTFDPPQPSLPCGISFSNLNAYTTCQFVSGATAYRFSFYDNSTNALVAVKTQTSNYIYFNQVPGLCYGKTYKWTVEAQYNSGSGLVFGPPGSNLCTVSFSGPQATLPCGPTYTSYNAYSTSSFVSGTNAYRFTFYDVDTDALVAVKTNTNNYVYFNQVPGLVYNKTYKWTVEVQYNNGSGYVFGPPSSNSCTMTWGTPYQVSIESEASDVSTARMFSASEPTGESFIVNAYPNPNNGTFTIDLSEDRQVEISNILGEKISEQSLIRGPNRISLESQPDGIYFVKIRSDNRQDIIKIIKEN